MVESRSCSVATSRFFQQSIAVADEQDTKRKSISASPLRKLRLKRCQVTNKQRIPNGRLLAVHGRAIHSYAHFRLRPCERSQRSAILLTSFPQRNHAFNANKLGEVSWQSSTYNDRASQNFVATPAVMLKRCVKLPRAKHVGASKLTQCTF